MNKKEPQGKYVENHQKKLVMVNPFSVKKLKELDDNSPKKTDAKDPKTIAKLVVDGRYSIPYMPVGIYAEIRDLVYSRDMMSDESIPEVGADVYMRMGDCFYKGFGVEKDLLIALRFMNTAENFFYRRLMDGDFYQKSNLNHVLEVESAIRKEIGEDLIPDLSWAKYNG